MKSLQKKQKQGFQASNELINRLIRALVQTGLLTSLCAILDLIFFLTDVSETVPSLLYSSRFQPTGT